MAKRNIRAINQRLSRRTIHQRWLSNRATTAALTEACGGWLKLLAYKKSLPRQESK